MALATSNLHLDDIATALGETATNVCLSGMCMSSSVNAGGLDETYCTGATSTLRLQNLQSVPYYQGKFRGYDHAASTLFYIGAKRNESNTCPIDSSTHVYSSGTTIKEAYDNDYDIFVDSAGDNYAADGWYTTTGDTNTYYVWDSGEVNRWGLSGTCVTEFSATASATTSASACLDTEYETYYHDGAGAQPVANDTVYNDIGMSTPTPNGYYGLTNDDYILISGEEGIIDSRAACK